MEIISFIKKTGTVILTIICLCQVGVSVVFWWRARNVKSISWLPKFIMIRAVFEGVYASSLHFFNTFFKYTIPATVRHWVSVVSTIMYPTILGLLFRFERGHYLRAQKEKNTQVIKVIEQTKNLQIFFVVALVFAEICTSLGSHGTDVLNISPKTALRLETTGMLFDMGVVCLLSFSMAGVNYKLAILFNLVRIKSFIKKAFALFLISYIISFIKPDAL